MLLHANHDIYAGLYLQVVSKTCVHNVLFGLNPGPLTYFVKFVSSEG